MRPVAAETTILVAIICVFFVFFMGIVNDRLINMENRLATQLDRIEAVTKKLPTSTDAHGYYEEMMNEIDKIAR